MRALNRTAAGVALAAFSIAAPLLAADKKKNLPRHKIGPIYVTPQLRLASGIDTNVFQSFAEPTRDAVTILSPRLDGALPVGRRLFVSGFGAMDLNYFRRQGDERSTDFQGAGRAELTLGRLLLFGGGGGGQFNQRFSIDVDDRLKRQEKRAYAGVTWRLSRRLSTTVQGSGEVLTFAPGTFRLGGDIKESMDRNTLAGTAQLRWAVTRRTTLLLSAEAQEDRFFSQPPSFPNVRESRRYLGGFEFGERAVLNGRFLAGVREFPGDLAQVGTPAYRGPVVSVDIVLPVGRVGRFRLLADRDVVYASSLVEVQTLRYRNAFVYERVLGEAVFDLPLSLVGIASAGFEQGNYLLPVPYPDASSLAPRVDHRWTGGLSLFRRFGDAVRVGGQLLWARRVSNLPVFSYEGLRYGLTAEFRP